MAAQIPKIDDLIMSLNFASVSPLSTDAQIANRDARTSIQNSRFVILISEDDKDISQNFFPIDNLVFSGDVSAFLRANVADDVAGSFPGGVHFDNCAKFHCHPLCAKLLVYFTHPMILFIMRSHHGAFRPTA